MPTPCPPYTTANRDLLIRRYISRFSITGWATWKIYVTLLIIKNKMFFEKYFHAYFFLRFYVLSLFSFSEKENVIQEVFTLVVCLNYLYFHIKLIKLALEIFLQIPYKIREFPHMASGGGVLKLNKLWVAAFISLQKYVFCMNNMDCITNVYNRIVHKWWKYPRGGEGAKYDLLINWEGKGLRPPYFGRCHMWTACKIFGERKGACLPFRSHR